MSMLFWSLRALFSPEKRLRALHNPSITISCFLSGKEAYANFSTKTVSYFEYRGRFLLEDKNEDFKAAV
jgi:hypothetical protein